MRLDSVFALKEEVSVLLPRMAARRDGEAVPVGLGAAPTSVPGQFRLAVRPRFEGDLPETALAYLRRTSGGELDIRYTGIIEPMGRKLTVGCSTAHRGGRTGTLGFFARRERDGAMGFVSANHVIAALDKGQEGDEIFHPAMSDGGRTLGDCVGLLAGDYPRLNQRGPRTVDCAFARLVDGVEYEACSVGAGDRLSNIPAPPEQSLEVGKIGRTTGRTSGRITAFALDDSVINYAFGEARFKAQIEIESADKSPFSRPGDSGSVVFTADGHPLGLVYSRSAAGGASNMGLTMVNPIAVVLDALGVSLVI